MLNRPRPRGAPHSASFVLRVVELRGRRRYLLQDLRNGEEMHFAQALLLQRWLRKAGLSGLR
jgi:hypothetical protein